MCAHNCTGVQEETSVSERFAAAILNALWSRKGLRLCEVTSGDQRLNGAFRGVDSTPGIVLAVGNPRCGLIRQRDLRIGASHFRSALPSSRHHINQNASRFRRTAHFP
jgi:hypothetical protein